MRISKHIAQALCCQAWGITPKQFKAMVKQGEIKFQDVMASAVVHIASQPLSAQALSAMLFPGMLEEKHQRMHDNINNETFAALLAMKKAAEEKQQKTEATKPEAETETAGKRVTVKRR